MVCGVLDGVGGRGDWWGSGKGVRWWSHVNASQFPEI